MFRGNYNFFEYKYNIENYHGQDYGSFAQYFYLIISIILIIVLLIILRKSSREKVNSIIKFIGIFMIVFYIIKTTWESYYDIKLSGSFNTGLLPFDTCSIIMYACLISGFCKGKVKKYADAWLVTGGMVGGIAAMLFLNAFKYYPFLSFGAFYSMIWHFLMVFVALLLVVTGYVKINYSVVLHGFAFHFVISIVVIIIDFIYNFDFMLYLHLSSIPYFEDIASKLTSMNMQMLNPLLMLFLYFVAFNIIYLFYLIIRKFKIVYNTFNN